VRQIAAGFANTARSVATQIANLFCFPAGTLVATINGLQNIESIVTGQKVWAFDVVKSEWRSCRVLETYESSYDDPLSHITVAGESIQATYLHPFWVVRGENLAARPCREHLPLVPSGATTPGRWVDAADLQVGDEMLLRDGRICPIEDVRHLPFLGAVYNLEVEELHCYAVGENSVLAHNGNGTLERMVLQLNAFIARNLLLTQNLLSGFGFRISRAASRLGIYLGEVEIVNGVARINIQFTSSLLRADLHLFRNYLTNLGATSAVVRTGFVINPTLRQLLTRLANSGRTLFGGLVEIESGSLFRFRITFPF